MIFNSITYETENPVAGENDVRFFDYDGTIRYSYTTDEFLALNALPPNPKHDELVAEGWNYTLSEAKAYVTKYKELDLVQFYHPKDADLVLYVFFPGFAPSTFSFNLSQSKSSDSDGYGFDVDWGDGTIERYENPSNISHIYNSTPGNYIIKLKVRSSTKVSISGNFTSNKSITNVFVSKKYNLNAKTYMFRECIYLESLSQSTNNYYGGSINTEVKYHFLYMAYSIPFIYISNSVTEFFGSNFARNCSNLKNVVLPKNLTTAGDYTFLECNRLYKICLPDSLTEIRDGTFQNCSGLNRIHITENIENIYSNAFIGCKGLREIWFHPSTAPTVSASNAWANLNTSCIIYAPYASIPDYVTATNYPDPATYTYIGFGTIADNTEVPANIGASGLYALTWYPTKDDAIAQTNSISFGNGNEIYCRYQYTDPAQQSL